MYICHFCKRRMCLLLNDHYSATGFIVFIWLAPYTNSMSCYLDVLRCGELDGHHANALCRTSLSAALIINNSLVTNTPRWFLSFFLSLCCQTETIESDVPSVNITGNNKSLFFFSYSQLFILYQSIPKADKDVVIFTVENK